MMTIVQSKVVFVPRLTVNNLSATDVGRKQQIIPVMVALLVVQKLAHLDNGFQEAKKGSATVKIVSRVNAEQSASQKKMTVFGMRATRQHYAMAQQSVRIGVRAVW